MEEKDLLYEAALYYKQNFENKRFHLRAAKKGVLLEFDILFTDNHFKHLLGLHKLTDIAQVKPTSAILYQRILNKELSHSDIEFSLNYLLIEDRLKYFKELKSVLYSKQLMIKSLHGEFNTILADFMLTQQNTNYGYTHLFLKEEDKGFTIPVTFFTRKDNTYLRNNPNKWTVLSIEEIEHKKTKD